LQPSRNSRCPDVIAPAALILRSHRHLSLKSHTIVIGTASPHNNTISYTRILQFEEGFYPPLADQFFRSVETGGDNHSPLPFDKNLAASLGVFV